MVPFMLFYPLSGDSRLLEILEGLRLTFTEANAGPKHSPLPQDSYIKEPVLIDHEEGPTAEPIGMLVFHKVKVRELQKKHLPTSQYRGNLCRHGRSGQGALSC